LQSYWPGPKENNLLLFSKEKESQESITMSYSITGGTGSIAAFVARLLAQNEKGVGAYDLDPRQEVLESLMGK
jgi:hypothetical protein